MSLKYEVDITKPGQTKFRYEILAEVRLNQSECEFLQKLASEHYDRHCRSVGEQGGFLYGMRNHAEFNGTDPVHVLRFQAIDTLCKILEPTPGGTPARAGKTMRGELWERLRPLLDAINVETRRLNGPIE